MIIVNKQWQFIDTNKYHLYIDIMGATVKEIIAGRKTFFVTPDHSIFPESFCEDYLERGYECYFIENEKKIPLDQKIEIIISIFKDVILFFNLDAQIPGIDWYAFIASLREKHGDNVVIGTMFKKRSDKNEKLRIEYAYNFNLNLNGGCIQLDLQKKNNYSIIENVLCAAQARGRRKNVRALGNNACSYNFKYDSKTCNGVLQDISISHFSVVLPSGKVNIEENRMVDIQFNLDGFHFSYPATLFAKRPLEEEGNDLFVFMFSGPDGSGVDTITRQHLVPRLYDIMHGHMENLLTRLFETFVRKRSLQTA